MSTPRNVYPLLRRWPAASPATTIPPVYGRLSILGPASKIKDRKYGSGCARVITDLAEGRLSAATSTLALVEVTNALRKIGLGKEVALEINSIYSTGITVTELLNVDVRLTVELFRSSSVSSYDCAHAAIMKRIGLDTILSA